MLQITRIDLHHKLQLLIRICFLLDYHLLFLKFLLLALIKCLFAGKHIHKNYCCSSPKIPCPANKYLLNAAAETLLANSRDCASLLTTCSISSKTLFKLFLVYYEHVFVYCDVFAVTICFTMSLLSILNIFHNLIYFHLLSVLYWVQKKPPEMFFNSFMTDAVII